MKKKPKLVDLQISLPVRLVNWLRDVIAPVNLEELVTTAIRNELSDRDRRHKKLVRALDELRRSPVIWHLPIPGKTHRNSSNTDSAKLIHMLRKHDQRIEDRKLSSSVGVGRKEAVRQRHSDKLSKHRSTV